jgi:hypothetical protein
VERSNLRKLNELEVRKLYQIKISNMFTVLENLSDNEDINKTLENIKEIVRTPLIRVLGLYKFKEYKLWFDEICLIFLDQRKQSTMQWLHYPNQNNVRHEAFRYLFIHSIPSNDRSKASSKTVPPHSAIQSLLLQMSASSPIPKAV